MKNLLFLSVMMTVFLSLASFVVAQGNVIIFEEEHIQGEIEKPEAFYILSPSNLEYESIPPEETFLEEIYDTLESTSFKRVKMSYFFAL